MYSSETSTDIGCPRWSCRIPKYLGARVTVNNSAGRNTAILILPYKCMEDIIITVQSVALVAIQDFEARDIFLVLPDLTEYNIFISERLPFDLCDPSSAILYIAGFRVPITIVILLWHLGGAPRIPSNARKNIYKHPTPHSYRNVASMDFVIFKCFDDDLFYFCICYKRFITS